MISGISLVISKYQNHFRSLGIDQQKKKNVAAARIGFWFCLRAFTSFLGWVGQILLRLCITLQWLQPALLGGGTNLVLLLTDQDPVGFG